MNEKTIIETRAFDGRFLKIDLVDVELDGGLRTTREIVRHPGATAVLPQLPDGRFVLVRQFRKPVDRAILEIMAGTLEPDEQPDDCARRELTEETGYAAETLTKLGAIFPAPGYTSERIHLYHATLSPKRLKRQPDEDERIDVVVLTEQELKDKIAAGEINDAKTLAAWLLYTQQIGGGA